MCFKRGAAISTQNGGPLKLVDKFTCFDRSISSTESDDSMCLVKAWTANAHIKVWSIRYNKTRFFSKQRLYQYYCMDAPHGQNASEVWSIRYNKTRFFSEQWLYQYYCMDAPHGHWQNASKKSFIGTAQECYELYWINPGSNTPPDNSCTATYLPSLKPSK